MSGRSWRIVDPCWITGETPIRFRFISRNVGPKKPRSSMRMTVTDGTTSDTWRCRRLVPCSGTVTRKSLPGRSAIDLSPFVAMKRMPNDESVETLTTWLLSSGRNSVPARGRRRSGPGQRLRPLTDDHQWIHVDAGVRRTCFGGRSPHGYLTLPF